MKRTYLKIILPLVLIGLASIAYFTLFTPAEFRVQANPAPACKTAVFDKSALVFDSLLICGTSEVGTDNLTHAANVAAEWLDNDEDGQVDEPRLLEAFGQTKPVLLMSGRGISPAIMPRIMSAYSDQRVQDLYASETNPGNGERDASQEEIHHIIMNAGWQSLFPAVFSEQASDNSMLYQAWKTADSNRHYVYNDPTCDDSCKVTEFVYLATAAYMETGAELDLASDEMRLKTRAALTNAIPSVIDIFESSDYTYPINHWPDGNYPQQDNIVFFGIQ